MARIDRNREELGWLKIVFAVLAAIDVSLVGWLAQNYGKASWVLVLAAVVGTATVSYAIARVNLIAYNRIEELEDL